jgi:hypothetical protein
MSRKLYFGIEYLGYVSKDALDYKCLKEDIGDIIPLIFRDFADELFEVNPSIKPGNWFKQDSNDIYYFYLSDIPNIIKKLNKIKLNNPDSSDEFSKSIDWIKGLKVLIDFLLDEQGIYINDYNTIRIIGYIE